jgi:hypothetical protein
MTPLPQRLAAEALGSAFLLAAVVGSGTMAQRLAGGNVALALLGNTLPTGAILVVLITIFGPLSGAHFNPAVSLAFALRGELPWRQAGLPRGATRRRHRRRLGRARDVRPAALAGVDHGAQRRRTMDRRIRRHVRPAADHPGVRGAVSRRGRVGGRALHHVGLLFTASTSFANPAVTVARALSDRFAGIAPTGALAFIAARRCRWRAGCGRPTQVG